MTDARISSEIACRLEKEVHWNCDQDSKVQIHDAVQYLLATPLSADAAVQIALLNNQNIQATFEEVGIAQADLVQAGLFQNPLFEGFVRFPTNSRSHINAEFSVATSFLDLFLIPLRQKVAQAQLEQAQLNVSHEILQLACDVQETYVSLLATQKKEGLMKEYVHACLAAKTLSELQYEKGNINSLEKDRRYTEFLEASLLLSQIELETIQYREHMNTLLGLSSSQIGWTQKDEFFLLPQGERDVDELEALAKAKRFDLENARWEVERIARMGGLTAWWTHVDGEAGLSGEKDAEGSKVLGPTIAGALPLFNYGQADRARLSSLYRQKVASLHALTIEIESEVRLAREKVIAHRAIVETYQQQALPLQREVVSMSQRFYNAMALGVYTLLDAKKHELHMQMGSLMALKEYWASQVALNRAVGGALPILR
jgi:cobalt-zinc-cadmium efflux system outer membrane protein